MRRTGKILKGKRMRRNMRKSHKKNGGQPKTALQKAEIEAEQAQRVLSKTRKRLEKYQQKLAKEKLTIYDSDIRQILAQKLPLDDTIIEIGKASQREVKRNKKLHRLITGVQSPIGYRHPPFDRVAYETAHRPARLGRLPSPEPQNSDDRRPLELLDFVPYRLGLY